MNTKKRIVPGFIFPIMIFGILLAACPRGGDGDGNIIPPAVTPPSVPTNVRATATSSTSITVTWDSVSNADNYEVHYKTGSLPITRLTTVLGTQHSHTGLQPNTAYSYYITAKNSLGTSDYSPPATATTPIVTTPSVTSVTVSPASARVEKGKTQSFSATVVGTNSPSQNVTWSIDQSGRNSGTTISTSGLLTVSANESLTTITVRATSTVDTSKNGTATVTVTTAASTTPSVTGVTVSPATATVEKGKTQSFSATVMGTNSPSQNVTWSIDQSGRNSGTTISTSGLLTVSVNETLTMITVRATSTADTSKNGTATVAVTSQPPPVTSVTVSPSTASVEKGKTQSFSATVAGTNSPSQNVTWSIDQSGKHSGTSISTGGLLTVSASESLTTITVRATSTADTSKNGTATVTVTTPIVNSVTVSPKTANVEKGKTQSFSATVMGPNSPPQTVIWSIVQTNKNSGTTINSTSGLLTVSANEGLAELTVRATSAFDTSKSDAATVTVTTAASTAPTVTGVTVSPATVYVTRGSSQSFSATVMGTNNPSQDVTWSVLGATHTSGTAINSRGVLNVSASERLGTIQVKATSKEDANKTGVATVYIPR